MGKKTKNLKFLIDKKYEFFLKDSAKQSNMSMVQFSVNLVNNYVKKHNIEIDYIPMPPARGRKEGYNK